MKKKILVIGGAGFVGSNLCKALVNEGHVVDVLDNLLSGSLDNLEPGLRKFAKADAADVLHHFKPDYDIVYHFGEYSRVEQSFEEISRVLTNNNQLIHVLEFCKLSKAKLIYSASSTKFADDGENLSPYTWSKANNVNLIKAYKKWNPDFDYKIAYFFNVYGENEISDGKYATVVGKFLRLYKEGKSLPVTLPGSQQRNFTHVSDVVRGLCALITTTSGNKEFGFANTRKYSILELASLFNTTIELKPERRGNRLDARLGFVENSEIDLGWRAKIDLDQYIKENITN